jgi:ribulose-5-phosphate 4-epimerase/fuculose-1-phosphate aldolase|tara:strand:+ start:1958 stop:2734 length:777 start_codon:yes stop_codon:yes gene_type:complete
VDKVLKNNGYIPNINNDEERKDLAAAFRWAERSNLHEAVANHFSLAVNPEGTKFLMNPNMWHFSRIKASDLLLLDVNDKSVLDKENAPDATAWGLHGAIHKMCPHARCIMHVHSVFATALASLEDCILPPINQVASIFFGRQIADKQYGGLAFEEEGARCAKLLSNSLKHTMIMGNHGVLIFGKNVAETFNRLFYFERAAEIYINALQTGKELSILDDITAEKTANELDNEEFPNPAGTAFLREIRLILDQENSNYKD